MAVVATLKASGSADLATSPVAASEALGAISFTAGSLIVVQLMAIMGSSAAGALTCAAPSHTFATQASAYQGVSDKASGESFTAVAVGGSTTITIGTGASSTYGMFYAVYEVTGFDTGDPIDAVIGLADNTTDGAKTITLSGAPAASSVVLAGCVVDTDAGLNDIDGGTGWTEDAQVDSSASFFGGAQFQQRTGSTSASVLWNDIRAGASVAVFSFAGVAIEVAAGAGDAEEVNPVDNVGITDAADVVVPPPRVRLAITRVI